MVAEGSTLLLGSGDSFEGHLLTGCHTLLFEKHACILITTYSHACNTCCSLSANKRINTESFGIHAYVRTNTCIHTYTHAHMHACMHTCIYTSIHAYIHIQLHTYIHACTHEYIYIYICTSFVSLCLSLCPCTRL